MTNLAVIETKSGVVKGFVGKNYVAAFKAGAEPIDRSFLEEFRNDPKGVLDAYFSAQDPEDDLYGGEDDHLLLSTETPFQEVGAYLDGVSEFTGFTFDKLDKLPETVILEHVQQLIAADKLDLSAIGLLYLIYQRQVNKTNKCQIQLETLKNKSPNSAETSSTTPLHPQD